MHSLPSQKERSTECRYAMMVQTSQMTTQEGTAVLQLLEQTKALQATPTVPDTTQAVVQNDHTTR